MTTIHLDLSINAAIFVFALLAIATYLVYRYLIQPLLVKVPAVSADATTAGQGLLARLNGFKTMLVARAQAAAGVVIAMLVSVDQFVMPYLTDGTIPWQSWFNPKYALFAVPAVLIAGGLIHEKLRKVTTGPVAGGQG